MLASRRCIDCPKLIPAGSPRGRCVDCLREWERARGTRRQRGYDAAHDRESTAWRTKVKAGDLVLCWRCGKPITDPADMDLGHDDRDRSVTRGPEHARGCNRSAAGRASRLA